MALPDPITRREQYYSAIAGNGETPEAPITREEQYLDYIAKHGGGGGGTTDHRQLTNRNAANQHSMDSITGLSQAIEELENNTMSLSSAGVDITWDGDTTGRDSFVILEQEVEGMLITGTYYKVGDRFIPFEDILELLPGIEVVSIENGAERSSAINRYNSVEYSDNAYQLNATEMAWVLFAKAGTYTIPMSEMTFTVPSDGIYFNHVTMASGGAILNDVRLKSLTVPGNSVIMQGGEDVTEEVTELVSGGKLDASAVTHETWTFTLEDDTEVTKEVVLWAGA